MNSYLLDIVKKNVERLFQEGFIEGEMIVNPLYYVLWKVNEIEDLNKDYGLEEFANNYLAFASNGGNELIVIDKNEKIYTLPVIGMEDEQAFLIAENFNDLKSKMKKDS